MHSRIIVTLCALLAVFSPIGLVTHAKPDEDQAKRELLGLEDEWLKASGDAQVQEHILADDFVHALPLGFITKQEQIDFLRSHRAHTDNLRRHFEDLRVRVYGTAAVVNGIVVAADNSGAVRKTVFTDVFAYRNGHWQAVNAQENDFKPQNK